jgi:hypothetical protein
LCFYNCLKAAIIYKDFLKGLNAKEGKGHKNNTTKQGAKTSTIRVPGVSLSFA